MRGNWVLDKYDTKTHQITLRKIDKQTKKPAYTWKQIQANIGKQLEHYIDLYPYKRGSAIEKLTNEFIPLFTLCCKSPDHYPTLDNIDPAIPLIKTWKQFKGALNHFFIDTFTTQAVIMHEEIQRLGKQKLQFYKGQSYQQSQQTLASNLKFEKSVISYLYKIIMKLKFAEEAITLMQYYVLKDKFSLRDQWPKNMFNYKNYYQLLISSNDLILKILHTGYRRYQNLDNPAHLYNELTFQKFSTIVLFVPEIKIPFVDRNAIFSLYFKIFTLQAKSKTKQPQSKPQPKPPAPPPIVQTVSPALAEQMKKLKRQQKRKNAKKQKNQQKQLQKLKQLETKQQTSQTKDNEQNQQQSISMVDPVQQKIQNLSSITCRIPIKLSPQFIQSMKIE